VRQNRLPHALVFAGPAGIGKRTLALLLARMLNCDAPEAGRPCGRCSPCRKILAKSHPDVRLIEPDGANIRIEQTRELIAEMAYQPFEARTRVVILDPADQMQAQAANSLLKTLEEPASRTVLVLVTPRPYMLLVTIRSRARILQFGPIAASQLEDHLAVHLGKTRQEARLAALFSGGSLGAALEFDSEGFREARAKALRYARSLLARGSFTEVSALVSEVAKDKEGFPAWLDALSAILQDTYYAHVAPRLVGQSDIGAELKELSAASSRESVASTIRSVQAFRRSLQSNVNRAIGLEALFLGERRAARPL
jgi:DNA polymerase-3 subunit delta'